MCDLSEINHHDNTERDETNGEKWNKGKRKIILRGLINSGRPSDIPQDNRKQQLLLYVQQLEKKKKGFKFSPGFHSRVTQAPTETGHQTLTETPDSTMIYWNNQ